MDLHTNALDEVLIRDLPIAILIKEVEYCVTLGLSQRETPMLKKENQLTFIYVRVIVFIEVFKCLPDRVPLLSNLFDEFVKNYAVGHDCFLCKFDIISFSLLLLFLMHLKVHIAL